MKNSQSLSLLIEKLSVNSQSCLLAICFLQCFFAIQVLEYAKSIACMDICKVLSEYEWKCHIALPNNQFYPSHHSLFILFCGLLPTSNHLTKTNTSVIWRCYNTFIIIRFHHNFVFADNCLEKITIFCFMVSCDENG